MTAMERVASPVAGETGHFSPATVGKAVAKELQPTYYVAGPPGDGHGRPDMVKSAGVTNEDIRSEKFAGY